MLDHRADGESIDPLRLRAELASVCYAGQVLAVVLLSVVPEARGDVQNFLELQGGLRSDRRLALDDLIDRLPGAAGTLCQLSLRNTALFQDVQQRLQEATLHPAGSGSQPW